VTGDQASTPATYRLSVIPLLILEPEVSAGGIQVCFAARTWMAIDLAAHGM
jgi:hypothetical protein